MNRQSHKISPWLIIIASITTLWGHAQEQFVTPKEAPLVTPWGETVNEQQVHNEYPRPLLQRSRWMNLNGRWEFQEAKEGEKAPVGQKLKETIVVPFPWEAPLSGIRRQIPSQRAWYRRTFSIPDEWKGKRIRLNFDAVDWETFVYVNGRCIGTHKGGYDAFSFDITPYLKAQGKQEIIVGVYDPSDKQPIARGKQSWDRYADPEGCFYTPNSGIWQTVWLEPVDEFHIKDLKITPDPDRKQLKVMVTPSAWSDSYVTVRVKAEGKVVTSVRGGQRQEIRVPIENPRLWSPEDPFLYDLEVELTAPDGKIRDAVQSYAGMRTITVEKIGDIPRICLNHQPIYQHGPLDQGFWPDGIYTAPSDEALKWEIENMKEWGFNMVRKHIKVEPQRWYYWCDKLGLLVWQDMPQADGMIDAPAKMQIETELANMIYQHQNHPSIVVWVVFNEHWGLFDVERITNNVMQLDPSRLVTGNSGIDARTPHIDYEIGHIKDNHSYLPPNLPMVSHTRATVNGEYGALGYLIEDHKWSGNGKYFHNYYQDKSDKKQAATDEYVKFMEQIHNYIPKGLSATVYTQWTDVENEVNGLYTYDRKIEKLDKARVRAANEACYELLKKE